MKSVNETLSIIQNDNINKYFSLLYGNDKDIIVIQKERYINLINEYKKIFADEFVTIFSSPGRTEIGGNHTDHNHGKVLAASVTLDCIGVASKSNNDYIKINDLTFSAFHEINVNETEKKNSEKGTLALVRGIVAGFKKFGFNVGGFNLCEISDVISAAGVSSSAAFEMLICKILDVFYNENSMTPVDYAKIGQYAENIYWEKGSGMMDQMACAFGGMIAIDFKNPLMPQVEQVKFDFASKEFDLLIVNTGGNHADLSEEYSSIPNDMKAVARELGCNVLREAEYEDFLENFEQIRRRTSDRAVLRAMHFYEENQRVSRQVNALTENNFEQFLTLINDSGNSSWKWLQNTYCNCNPYEQGITVFLALSEIFIQNIPKGACRVHGGGFAGVIAVFLPKEYTSKYTEKIKKYTGSKEIYRMSIREQGVICMEDIM